MPSVQCPMNIPSSAATGGCFATPMACSSEALCTHNLCAVLLRIALDVVPRPSVWYADQSLASYRDPDLIILLLRARESSATL
nr:hypothetical protein CFP56_34832 [Quercus suber]